MATFKRGNIYFIQSSYTEQGVEQRGDRPAVIVSNNIGNEKAEHVEIVYMTTQPKNDLPTHVLIRSALKPSTLLCEQIITVSKERVGTLIGTLTEQEIQQMDTALAISIGLNFAAPIMVREPTKEEVEQRAKEMLKHMAPPEPSRPEKVETDLVKIQRERDLYKKFVETDLVKIQTERDLYKKFSEDLVQVLKGGK